MRGPTLLSDKRKMACLATGWRERCLRQITLSPLIIAPGIKRKNPKGQQISVYPRKGLTFLASAEMRWVRGRGSIVIVEGMNKGKAGKKSGFTREIWGHRRDLNHTPEQSVGRVLIPPTPWGGGAPLSVCFLFNLHLFKAEICNMAWLTSR